MRLTCHSCGKGVEGSPGKLPCEVLKDWITVSRWKGPGAVSHYNFCSLICLKSWVDAHVPRVPEVFLESFEEDKSWERVSMDEEIGQLNLLKKSGYSDKAIEYFINKVNVGEIEKPNASFIYTGPCGDTMQIYLKINGDKITEAKFQVIGCAGSYTSGSALMEMIKGGTLDQAKKISEEEIINYLGGVPAPKIHCVCLAKRTLEQAIEQYKKAKSKG